MSSKNMLLQPQSDENKYPGYTLSKLTIDTDYWRDEQEYAGYKVNATKSQLNGQLNPTNGYSLLGTVYITTDNKCSISCTRPFYYNNKLYSESTSSSEALALHTSWWSMAGQIVDVWLKNE